MKAYPGARPLVRTAIIAWAACAAATLRAADADDEAPPTDAIVVDGQRKFADRSPATSEGIDAATLNETTHLINSEDALRYLPSLLVRKRHIGDAQAPLATRTSGVSASARSLIYADGVLLSALIGNNNTVASPRWGMVSPEEIERVDVLYGPFSAAYPGNSIGAVVNFTTRLPDRFEGSLNAGTSVQKFKQYGTSGTFPAYQLAGTAGDRIGPLAWFVSANHVASRGQPLAYANVARPAYASNAGTPVTGAYPDVNRLGAPIYVIGAAGFEDQQQDNLKLKLALDVGPSLRLAYRGGLFLNDTDSTARSYLGSAGGPVYAGTINIDGRPVNIPTSAFSNNVYRLDERHWMHALSIEGASGRRFEWEANASLYDFDKDVQRLPSGALPAANAGGAGSIVKLDGTGWRTADLKARWRPRTGHDVGFGLHYDRFQLSSDRFATSDWRRGTPGALTLVAKGRTRTVAAWIEDRIGLGETLDLKLGGRFEWWRAYRGFNFSLSPALSVSQPELNHQAFSPKASLRWTPMEPLSLTLSAGQAYRFPTVSELYQTVTTGPTITVPDPRLRPERARSEEFAAEWTLERGRVRLSLFNEEIKDVLIAQTAPLVPGSSTLFSYVQNIPKVHTRGLELAFEHKGLLPKLDLSGSVTLADPTIVDDPAFPAAEGKVVPQVPRRRATLVATYRPADAASLTVAGRHSSRSFATIDNSDSVTHTYQGFEGYLVVDVRATFKVGRHWEAGIGIENIGNEKYFLFHPFPQRSFNAEMTYRW